MIPIVAEEFVVELVVGFFISSVICPDPTTLGLVKFLVGILEQFNILMSILVLHVLVPSPSLTLDPLQFQLALTSMLLRLWV